MGNIKKLTLAIVVLLIGTSPAFAGGWCSFAPGEYDVISHGTKSSTVWIFGTFVGEQPPAKWVPIRLATYGESNVAMALAAQLADKGISVYLDGANDSCANYVSWSGVIRHVRIDN